LELILQEEYFFLHTVSSMTPIFAETEWNGESTDRQTDSCLYMICIYTKQRNWKFAST